MTRLHVASLVIVAGCSGSEVACVSDGFDGATVDVDQWQVAMPQDISEAGGTLTIALPARQNANALVASNAHFDLTGRSVTATVVQSVTPSAMTQDELTVLVDDSNELSIVASDGQLLFRQIVAGVPSDAATAIAYDASIDHWRISHDAATGMIAYATAAGSDFTVRGTIAAPFAIDAVRVQLEADEYNGGTPSPGVAEFAALVVDPEQCSSDHSHAPPI